MGRPANEIFEQRVLDEMLFTSLKKVDNEEKAAVVANICYSHDTIIHAAKKVQREVEFQGDLRVKKLKFRRTWVRGFLRRNAMRPRRITAQSKTLPPPEVVQAAMAKIQEVISSKGFSPEEVFNGDESGMNHCAPPRIQYVPQSAERALAPEADDKARFTVFFVRFCSRSDAAYFLHCEMCLKQRSRSLAYDDS